MLTAGIRKHVFTDIRPYVCTFEECDLKLFADRHAWFNHELECHRLEWRCRFCSHPPFGSETKLSTHMRQKHAQFSLPSQLPALIKASRQSVDRISATACPLCHWDATLRDLNRHTPLDETLVVTLEQFRQHLGAHMEQLALFALPRSYKEEETANSNEAAAMAHSDSQSRHLSTEEMSWKTLSSREMTIDKAIPDVSTSIAPDIGVHPRDSDPWSCKLLDMSKCDIKPFPNFRAAVSQRCSKEGYLYGHGGSYYLANQKQDMWTIDTDGTSTCYPIATKPRGPGPRSHHAALLFGNTFIVFGGLTTSNPMDNSLYLMDTSEVRPALSQSETDLARHKNLVDSCTSYKTFC